MQLIIRKKPLQRGFNFRGLESEWPGGALVRDAATSIDHIQTIRPPGVGALDSIVGLRHVLHELAESFRRRQHGGQDDGTEGDVRDDQPHEYVGDPPEHPADIDWQSPSFAALSYVHRPGGALIENYYAASARLLAIASRRADAYSSDLHLTRQES